MSIRKIARAQWFDFFDRISPLVVGKHAELEISSMAIGAQVIAHWLPVHGIAYDPKDDILEIALDGLDHIVHAPREIYVDDPPVGTLHVAVTDRDGVLRVVTLADPLMLPAFTG